MTEINCQSIQESAIHLIESADPLKARVVDLTKDYPEISYIFERNGQFCFSKGDIQVVKGKAKSGKTTFMIALLVAIINQECMKFKAIEPELRALYIDTEQNPINTAKFARKVHSLCDLSTSENFERFIAVNLRGDNPDERKQLITEAIKKYSPEFIIIDGIRDLIEGGDINSPTQATETVQYLMNLTKEYNVSILTVLHENKNDEHLRGHIGTELLNKCSEVWHIKKNEEIHEVTQIENRNAMSGMIRYSFKFDQNNLPILSEINSKMSLEEKNYQSKLEGFQYCLANDTQLSYPDLKIKYSEFKRCKEKTAEKHITEFIKSRNLIRDEATKLYRLQIRDTNQSIT